MRPALAAIFDDYAAYHRDPVNVRIHEVAVPAIVFHVVAMLDWVGLGVEIGGFAVTLGVAVVALAALWYAWMSPRLAALVVPFTVACLWLGRQTPPWAVVAVAVIAWVAQLVGHARFERRAPAFKDNLVQLLVGPAFVAALLIGDRRIGADGRADGGPDTPR